MVTQRALEYFHYNGKGKGKVHLRTGHGGPTRLGVDVKHYARWGGWSTPRSGPFNPRLRPGTLCIGEWVGPRAGLDGSGKSCPHRDSIPCFHYFINKYTVTTFSMAACTPFDLSPLTVTFKLMDFPYTCNENNKTSGHPFPVLADFIP